jgi:hypothetical protein
MKKVLESSAAVAAAWVAQEQPEARAGDVSFHGPRYYSYGTVVGLLASGSGGGYALISSRKYSDSTSRQCGEARAAARRDGLSVFTVPEMDENAVDLNLAHYEKLIEEACASITKAVRCDTAGQYRGTALKLIGTAMLYARMTKRRWTFKGTNPLGVPGKDAAEDGDEMAPATPGQPPNRFLDGAVAVTLATEADTAFEPPAEPGVVAFVPEHLSDHQVDLARLRNQAEGAIAAMRFGADTIGNVRDENKATLSLVCNLIVALQMEATRRAGAGK